MMNQKSLIHPLYLLFISTNTSLLLSNISPIFVLSLQMLHGALNFFILFSKPKVKYTSFPFMLCNGYSVRCTIKKIGIHNNASSNPIILSLSAYCITASLYLKPRCTYFVPLPLHTLAQVGHH